MRSGGEVPIRSVAGDSSALVQEPSPDVDGVQDESGATYDTYNLQPVCSNMPGVVYYSQINGCRWVSESGTQVTIYRNREDIVVINAVGRSVADEPASPPQNSGHADAGNIGISGSALTRLHEVMRILLHNKDSLSADEFEELDNELTYLLQALNLGADIKIAHRMLAQENVNVDTLSKMVQQISRNLNAQSISAVSEPARAALCEIFNDPNVDLPSISDELWNMICN